MSEKELVFLLEEPSAQAMLESLLPRLLPGTIRFRCIPFEGKQDLEKQMTRRMRGYVNPEARFIILRDQDSAPDCKVVKKGLMQRVEESGRTDKTLVRIACRELESFYLGDLAAVGQALDMPKLSKQQASRKFRTPDALGSPSKELATLTNNRYQKKSGSRRIGHYLDIDNNRSVSFKNLIQSIKRMERELIDLPD